MTETRIALVGAAGRMGREILRAAGQRDDVAVTAAVVPDAADFDAQAGLRAFAVADIARAMEECDVVIDFSAPPGFRAALGAARASGRAFVSGTTGIDADDERALVEAARDIPVLWAANFSVGVNALEHLVELASRALGDFEVEVFEAHHHDKVDAPSGTALFLGRAAARARDLSLDDVARWSRHGLTGRRARDEIGFQVLRGGSVVGEHTVYLCGDGERIELTHRAHDRAIFAQGAVRAAQWLVDQAPGRHTMRDFLFG